MRLPFSIVMRVASVGVIAFTPVELRAQDYKINVQGLQFGLHVQTDTPGGKVGWFGSLGDFVIDAPAVPGGRLVVKEGGNVGIGTATPSARLHIANASGSGAGLFVEASEGDRAAMYYSPNTGVVFDSFRPGDGRRLPVLLQPNGGNVGIGTPAPGKLLHLSTSTNSGHLAIGGANQNAMMFVNAANSTTNGFLVGRSYSSDDANTFFIYDLTAATNRLLIDPLGNVTIGTSPIAEPFHARLLALGGDDNAVINGLVGISGNGRGVFGRSTTNYGVWGVSQGSFGVAGNSETGFGVYGASASNYAGYFAGNAYVTGTLCAANISCASDARLKQDVRPLSYGLPEILRLRPVSWQWKDTTTTQLNLGLVAQEVEPVLPELILRSVDAQGSLGLNYMGLFPLLIKGIQEQQAQIDRQHEQLRAQQTQLDELRRLVCADHPQAGVCTGRD